MSWKSGPLIHPLFGTYLFAKDRTVHRPFCTSVRHLLQAFHLQEEVKEVPEQKERPSGWEWAPQCQIRRELNVDRAVFLIFINPNSRICF